VSIKAGTFRSLLLRVTVQIRPAKPADRLTEHSSFSQSINFSLAASPSLSQT
jgi:hypothetical protein